MPGEDEEIVNPGMYGKALAIYLQERLPELGYSVPSYCAEDWGWWVEIADHPYKLGLCIYCGKDSTGSLAHAVSIGKTSARAWNWRKFKSIDCTADLNKLFTCLIIVFTDDPAVEYLGAAEECPVGGDE
ncbi:MAG: hypothetical protein WD716_01370 [Fimbriimonadaceae bacterium]